jgi:hypothetical protein
MRHPVSTPDLSGGDVGRGAMRIEVVGLVVLPGFPEGAGPGAGEDSCGVGMVAAAFSGTLVDAGGPGRAVAGIVGETGDGGAQPVIAGEAEGNAMAFARSVGDGADAGLGGELAFSGEAFADIAELGEDLSGVDSAGTREGHDDAAVGQVGDGVFDAAGELPDGRDDAGQAGDQEA